MTEGCLRTCDSTPGPVVELWKLMGTVEEITEVASQIISSLGWDVVEVDGMADGVHDWNYNHTKIVLTRNNSNSYFHQRVIKTDSVSYTIVGAFSKNNHTNIHIAHGFVISCM